MQSRALKKESISPAIKLAHNLCSGVNEYIEHSHTWTFVEMCVDAFQGAKTCLLLYRPICVHTYRGILHNRHMCLKQYLYRHRLYNKIYEYIEYIERYIHTYDLPVYIHICKHVTQDLPSYATVVGHVSARIIEISTVIHDCFWK